MPEVTINDVRDGVNAALDENFPGVAIAGDEIKQGLEEPYFFVKLLQGSQTQELGRRHRRGHSFDIHYFGLDNRDMQGAAEKLYGIMGTISAAGSKYRGSSMTHEIVDRVLHFFVDYDFLVQRIALVDPVMGELSQQGGLKP